MYPWIGAASGATLGFIHNNFRGAYKYGRLGYRAGRWRQNKSQTRNLSRLSTVPPRLAKMAIARRARRRVIKTRPAYRKTSGGARKKPYSKPAAKPAAIRRAGGRKRQPTKRRARGRKGSGLNDQHAHDASFSHSSYGPGPRLYRGVKFAGVPNTFVCTTVGRLTAAINKQAVQYLPTWTTGGTDTAYTPNKEKRDGVGYGVTGGLLEFARNELQYQFQKQMGQPDGTFPMGWQQMRYCVKELKMTWEFKNMTNSIMHMTIYECVLRPGQVPNNIETPFDAWKEGLDTTKGPAGWANQGGTILEQPFITPFKSRKFCKYYRVYKVTPLILHPGHTHKHFAIIRPRNTWGFEDEEATAGLTNNLVAGVSTAHFITLRGGVTNDVTDANQVGFHGGAVDVICRSTCRFAQLEKSTKLMNAFHRLGTVASAQIMPEDEPQPTVVKMA